MSQNPLTDSGTGLKPALAAALASLEVQLEQELVRYRRTRLGIKPTSQSRVPSSGQNYPQKLTEKSVTMPTFSASTVENKIQPKPLPLPPTPPVKPAPVIIQQDSKKKALPQSTASVATTPTETPKQPLLPTADAQEQIPLPPAKSSDDHSNHSSIVTAIAQTNQSEKLLTNDASVQPDDYLESSEALLRSLTDEEPEDSQASNNANDSLLSPLGIGSMLLLLVASLTLGYVVFNPKGLPQLNFSKIFNNNPAPTPETPQTVENPQPQEPQAQLEPTVIPKYPNLAAKEFTEVKEPIDVVGLKPKVQPSPVAIAPANPIPAPTPTIPPVTAPLPQVQPLTPLDLSSTPSPQATPEATTTPSATIPEIKPSADGLYHIVIDNQDATSLATARKVIADAYLSKNNKLIYLATVKTKEEAERRLKRLQEKGLKARVQ